MSDLPECGAVLAPTSRRAVVLAGHLASATAALDRARGAGIDPQAVYLIALRALVAIYRAQLHGQGVSPHLGRPYRAAP